jgi:uncharacterized protein involved in exopolysaccharide biosynthesis
MTMDQTRADGLPSTASQIERLAGLLWQSRYLLIACAITGFGLGALVSWLTVPTYRATVVLMAAEDADLGGDLGSALSQAGGIAALVGLGGAGGNRTDEAIAVLASRQFTEGFIADFALLPQLFPKKWDSAKKTWRVAESRQPSLYDGFKRFDDVRKVRRDTRTGLVTLELVWPDADSAAVLANSLVSRVNGHIRARDIAEATRSIEQLNVELGRTQVIAVQSAIQKLIEANVKRRTLANTRPDYVFRVIDPAIPVGPKDYFRPQPVLYIAAGGFCGLLLGIVFVALRQFLGFLRRPA